MILSGNVRLYESQLKTGIGTEIFFRFSVFSPVTLQGKHLCSKKIFFNLMDFRIWCK